MGQKTNPNILRTGKIKKWGHSFTESKKQEFAKYSTNQLKIKEFLFKYFKKNNLQICKCHLFYSSGLLTTYIEYFVTDNIKSVKSNNKKLNFNKINLNKYYSKKKKDLLLLTKAQNKYLKFKKLKWIEEKSAFLNKKSAIQKTFYPNVFLKLKKLKNIEKNKKNTNYNKHKAKKFLNYKVIKKWNQKSSFNFKSSKFALLKKRVLQKNNLLKLRHFKFYKVENNALIKRGPKKKLRQKCKNKINYFMQNTTYTFFNHLISNAELNNQKHVLKNDFLQKIFKVLKVSEISISKIELNFKQIKLHFNKKQHNIIKENLIQLKRFDNKPFLKESLTVITLFLTNSNFIGSFSNYLATELQNHRKHNFFISFIERVLALFNKPDFCGYKKSIVVKIKGRFNGAPRSKEKTIFLGEKLSIINLDSKIYYSEKTSFSSNGTFGIKVWVN